MNFHYLELRVNAFVDASGMQRKSDGPKSVHLIVSGQVSIRSGQIRAVSYLELRVNAFVDSSGMQRKGDGQKSVHLIVLFVDQLHLEILVLEDLNGEMEYCAVMMYISLLTSRTHFLHCFTLLKDLSLVT